MRRLHLSLLNVGHCCIIKRPSSLGELSRHRDESWRFFLVMHFTKCKCELQHIFFKQNEEPQTGGGGCDDGPLLGGIVGGFFTFLCVGV